MPTIQSTPSAPAGSELTLRVVNFFERAIDGFTAWRRARATSNALRDLSDSQLADIGLDRDAIADVADALARR